LASVPLVRDGQLRATLFVNHRDPHRWTRDEIGLIEDVAERLWDTLERSRAEQEIRQLNASLEREVEARTHERDRIWRVAPVLMVVADDKGVLLEANPAWTSVLGWSRAETIGHDVMEFVAPEDVEIGAAGMAQLFAGHAVLEYQLTFLTRTGDRRRIAWTSVPEGGRLYGHGRDVTDQVVAEERLRQSQKMEAIGQLTSGIAHDFNNLLTGVTGSLELMQRRIDRGGDRELEPYLEAAQNAARRAVVLTQRLLAFSRQQTLDARPININTLVAGMEELVRQSVGPGIEIHVGTAPESWTTCVDPHQLENALLNLCINARDAMPDGGALTIQTSNHHLDEFAAAAWDLPPGQYLSLSVTDTGMGMAPETIRRAFDPFFTTKALGDGTGLGLSMIYGFARQSGGQARIESELGRGACVSIILPRHLGEAREEDAAPRGTALSAAADRHDGPGKAVLVVDDEAPIRMIVTEFLVDLGYAAFEAANGAEGLEALRSGASVDLLVTDVGLPGGMTGLQLAEAARALRPGLRVLFITGYADNAMMRNAKAPGVGILTKPFTLDVLAEQIAGLVADGAST
jgi:PAS domain S-box-containing protein